jgi:outer membrane protein assembly factor BamB
MPRAGLANPGWTVLAAQDHVVYTALATGRVMALSSTDGGAELWAYPAASQQASPVGCGLPLSQKSADTESPLDAVYGLPVITDKLVLVASYDHHLYGFDRETGERQFSFPKEGSTSVEGPVIGGLAVRDGVAYFGSSDARVYALDLATGEPVWQQPYSTGNWVWGTPAVDADRVYIGSMDHSVYALDRLSGELLWQRDLGASVPGAVTLTDGKLFVGTIDRHLYALSSATGEQLWQSELFGGWLWGEALVAGDAVYFGSLDGAVHAVKIADGSTLWSVTVDGAVRAGPALLGNDLVVGTDSGKVYLINGTSGDSAEVFAAEGQILSAPAVDDGIAYVGTATGNVYALDLARRGDPKLWVYPPAKK